MKLDKSKLLLLVLFSILICGVDYRTVNAQLNDSPPFFEEKSTKVRQYTPLELQLESFIGGLRVGEPKQAVEFWILGVNNRSGPFNIRCCPLRFKKKQGVNLRKLAG
jgi:hypothetical protein